jgi:hypothetical protein
MTGYDTDPLTTRPRMWPGRRGNSVQLVGVKVRSSDHFTRLWPSRPDQRPDFPFFLAAMLPLRLAALALLWLTSSPGRLVAALALVLSAVLAY